MGPVTPSTDGRAVLVTGGAGFVGVFVVGLLVERGYEVTVVDNFAVAPASRLDHLVEGGHVRVVEADLRDAVAVARALEEVRPWGIVHLAALHYIPYCAEHPAETLDVNVLGLQHVLDAASRWEVERFVFASTGDVYRPAEQPHGEDDQTVPTSVYGASKLCGEWLVRLWREGGAPTVPVVARLFNVYGPGETNPHVMPHVCESLRRGDEIPLGNVEARRDYTFVTDVAEVLVALLVSDLADVTVNVGTGSSWSVADAVERMRALTGRDLRIRVDQARLRKTDRPNLQADPTRLRHLLPDLSPTPFETGLRRLLESEAILPGEQAHQTTGRVS